MSHRRNGRRKQVTEATEDAWSLGEKETRRMHLGGGGGGRRGRLHRERDGS